MPPLDSDRRAQAPASLRNGDETVVAAPGQFGHASDGSTGGSEEMRRAARGQIALIEGSTPHLSQETRDLLRNRLRIAAVLFFISFLAFLSRWAFHWELWGRPEHRWLFYAHGAVTLALGVFAVKLCHRCAYSLGKLRIAELFVFGLPAIFFLLKQHHEAAIAMNPPEGHPYLPTIAASWLMLIFTYAIFIPNTWQRAVVVLGMMGLIPALLTAELCWQMPEYAALARTELFSGHFSGQLLMIGAAVLVGTVGVHTIGTLRTAAFAAKQLGQYRLKQRLGAGGMGEVYLAEHQMMKRPCAVKLIRAEKAGDPRMLARFEREVRATAKLSHWNSIDIYDFGRTADGTFYYVMEYLPGHNVGEIVEEHGPLSAGRTVYLMDQVCAALNEAHGIGLVHRDIKPANIFCAYRGGIFDVAKLLDFGLAKPTLDVKDGQSELTMAGTITGSPLFMSPEQATGGEHVDARSDIYSLGAVMYYLLTGQPPFAFDNPVKVMIAHASQDVTPPRQHNSEIPVELEEIVLRCLEKEPEDRYQDIASLQRSLRELLLDEPWTCDSATEWWHANGCPERKKLAAALVEAAAI